MIWRYWSQIQQLQQCLDVQEHQQGHVSYCSSDRESNHEFEKGQLGNRDINLFHTEESSLSIEEACHCRRQRVQHKKSDPVIKTGIPISEDRMQPDVLISHSHVMRLPLRFLLFDPFISFSAPAPASAAG